MTTEIACDDIVALRQQVTESFSPWSDEFEVSQAVIDSFAELTTDRQWIHVDVERASNGPFGCTVAHGFLVLSLLPAVRPPLDYRLTGWSSAANYGIRALRFLTPVRSGDRIRSRARLADVEEHRRGTLVTQEIQIQSVDSDKPALVFELQLLYMK